jgi:hypothetical protein
MAMYHHRTDLRTGEMVVIGKSGREVSALELAAIDGAAKAGQAEAIAVKRDLDWSIDTDGRPVTAAEARAMLAASIADCPDCRAEAMAAMGALKPTHPRGDRAASARAREHAVRRRKAARAARAKNRN